MRCMSNRRRRGALRCLLPALILGIAASQVRAGTLTLNVVGSDGAAVQGFRYVVEEDLTYKPTPGVADPDQHSLNFDRSHMPVVTRGESAGTGSSATISLPEIVPNKNYFVSVIPKTPGTYSIGGAPVTACASCTTRSVTVTLNKLPIPTAQIAVFVFHDSAPLNGQPDEPKEAGLAGFSIIVEDAGGSYGASAGTLSTDAFGNPLGTTYQVDANGNPVLDAEGSPIATGWAPLATGPDGRLIIKYLYPAKYGISVVPPAGQGWQQTTTIEGTKINDAWVKADEPPFFQEFGPPGPHVFFGFTKQVQDASLLTGGATLSGRITNLHMSAPPDAPFYGGGPFEHTRPWVGLNSNAGLAGSTRVAYAAPVDGNGGFTIPNVPPGDWQLVVFDDNLDLIFGSHAVSVQQANSGYNCNGLGHCSLGDIPVWNWFTRLHHYVFYDANENGMYEPELGEYGIPDQTINLRFRDGSINQTAATDGDGFLPFDEVFPFFSWLVAEVDYARYKATGATIVVDAGGPIPPPSGTPDWTFDGALNPQRQPENGGLPYRVELSTQDGEYAPVLTQGFQGFLGQTSVIAWGKKAYAPGQNGGISGVVYYATTRAEDDPRMAAAEPFEPGIPGITVNLYRLNTPTIPSNPNPSLLVKSNMTLVATTVTDSWDDNHPDGCVWDENAGFTYGGQSFPDYRSCFDGLRAFNQVRPGVFDGGYAFMECSLLDGQCVAPGTPGSVAGPIPPGVYVVEVVPPVDGSGKRRYEVQREQSRNVDFGDVFVPALLPPACADYDDYDGDGQPGLTVPAELELFPGVAAAFAGQQRPVCDRKILQLADQQNAAADFFLYTETPIAAHVVGFILDDTANEFDPSSPQFGEKFAPPWTPVSFHDFKGREVARALSDHFGRFSALVPSTYTKNAPSPSGVAPNMLISCMNSRVRADGTEDPNFDPKYSQFCYTFQYMPGKTTYLDTPVVPVGAFAGSDQYPVDCQLPDKTPRIASVSAGSSGPYVPATGGVITINSMGTLDVPNPDYCPGPPLTTDGACLVPNNAQTISRDFGFGMSNGTVTLGGVALPVVSWSPGAIVATVPAGTPTGELVVTRAAADGGLSSVSGVTVTVGLVSKQAIRAVPSAYPTIQAAIDAANAGDLVLVAPGVYNEMVIMWKPVQLQGWGESTVISAVKKSAQILQAWRNKAQSLLNANEISLLPGQAAGAVVNGVEPALFFSEEGAGVFVVARANGKNAFRQSLAPRIDGFTITGADTGGGIVVNGYADYLTISNNKISNNSGDFGGGIRVGHAALLNETNQGVQYTDADNDYVTIRHNQIISNGGVDGAGGGISVCTGSDGYQIVQNYVCGNFTLSHGAGIGHLGLSDNGLIDGNKILFNENFNQGTVVSGGGVFVGGQPPLAGQTLSLGSGTVTISGNLIQGNLAGVGDGGGIKTSNVNGQELLIRGRRPWRYRVDIVNNIIVNNVAALAGGGIALQDTAFSSVLFNTIAHNDSTATSSLAFGGATPNESNPQPAGIVSRAHTAALLPALASIGNTSRFSDPDLRNNIVWENRSFHFAADLNADPPVFRLLPDVASGNSPVFWDLGVLGTGFAADRLSPQYNVLTSTSGYPGNTSADPGFVSPYFNGGRGTTYSNGIEPTTAIQVPAAFDEGGNFIRVRFGLLRPYGNYHLGATSGVLNQGDPSAVGSLMYDIDGQPRVIGSAPDPGADEVPQP